VPERATAMSRSKASAEAVVVGATRQRAEREGQSRDMPLGTALHQKPGQPGRAVAGHGQAVSETASDEAGLARRAQTDCGAGELLGQALARENLARAWKRVKANKGSAGVDGCTVQDTAEYLKVAWPDIRQRLLDGTYKPEPVRRVALKVNESKTAVGLAWGRKFLGYCQWSAPRGEVKRAVADQAMHKLRDRLRQLTRRVRGRSMEQAAQDLQRYVPGWKAYFHLAQTPRIMRELDEWLRHRLRALQLKQWKRGTTMYRELRRLGASDAVARRIAASSRRWWRNSRMALNGVVSIRYFDELGIPRFS